jgi:all-trans-8'-apo-beta-carotenal 15,15'-oxygenase
MNRRTAIGLGLAGTALLSGGATSLLSATPSPAARPAAPHWLTLLGTSDVGERDYEPRVEGRIPAGLEGSLYRNGPGLFERGAVRKRHLLDGDGLVQRLTLRGGRARYQNRFVHTAKYREEEEAGRYLYATWSTRRPGGFLRNLGGGIDKSQAGVTVYPFNGALYAFDETSPAYRLDAETLGNETPVTFGDGRDFAIKAHTKLDPVSGDWLMAGVTHGRNMTLHVVTHGADGRLKSHHTYESPRQVYIHDFFATPRHIVFHLHPLAFSPWGFLAGLHSYVESLEWRPEEGSLVMVVPRAGGEAQVFEAPASFMWHTLNAYEAGGDIIADFVGYDAPDHFIGEDAQLRRLMEGEIGTSEAEGLLRRFVITPKTGQLREEILATGRHEFPMVDPRAATLAHRTAYLSSGGVGVLNSAIKRLDMETGHSQEFSFGPLAVAGEPVFAARPGGRVDEGWLITQVLDGTTGTSHFAIFDAEAVDAGPLADIRLDHALPISFHGAWAGMA